MTKMHRTLILNTMIALLLSLSSIHSALATTFYISPNGNNSSGNGSAEKPWASLSYACSRVRTAGDTIYINAGSYTDSTQCNLAVGVNVKGAAKSHTTNNSKLNDWYILANSNPPIDSRQTISGLTIDGSNRTLAHGISIIGRNYVTVDDMDFIHIRATAIKLEGYDWWSGADQERPPVPPPGYAVGCILSNIRIIGCSDVNYQTAMWVQSIRDTLIDNVVIDESASTGGKGNALKSWPGWVNHCIIRNSTFTVNPATSSDAITMEIWNFENDTQVYNNTFNEGYVSLVSGRKNGGACSLIFRDNKLLNTTPLGFAHELAVEDVDFYNNYITKESLGVWPAGHMYNLDGMSNIRIHNNIIYNTKGQSIVIQNAPASVVMNNIMIYNNVLDTTDATWPKAGVLISASNTISNLKIINNIFTNLSCAVYLYGSTSSIQSPVISYNDFYSVAASINATAPGAIISNNLSLDPQFSKAEIRPRYYVLSTSSPLISAGTDVGLPFSGSAPTIGAFEPYLLIAPSNLRVLQ
jgi:hypothetical protein